METADRILDIAEQRIRSDGYNAVSFRQLAQDVGMKSASVHYHFPTKEALGVAVAERYIVRIRERLGDPLSYPSREGRIDAFITLFKQALYEEGAICLCGMLGAEFASLPKQVQNTVRSFFDNCLEWLEVALQEADALTNEKAKDRAAMIISLLEGGMIVSTALQRPAFFETACKQARDIALS